jgi:hypothetical protein
MVTAIWELHALHGGHWVAICTIWEPGGAIWEVVIATWELRAPYRAYESYVPYSTAWEPHGSRHCMGAVGTIWEADGATCKLDGAIYELAYWSHMCLM